MTDQHGNRNGYPQIPGDASAFPVDLGDMALAGMSLRDWFAGQALTHMASVTMDDDARRETARRAYAFADAMIEVRRE